jgi:hypothetical protein
MLFPPELVTHVRAAMADHRSLEGVSDQVLAELLTLTFFASLEAEEGEYLPIRLVYAPQLRGREQAGTFVTDPAWTHESFAHPARCTARTLRKLSRATIPNWTFIHVGQISGELHLLGIAHRTIGVEDDRFIGLVSPSPGRLEIWSRGLRVLEYARGRLMPAPENVILSPGPVQRALEHAAEQVGARGRSHSLYFECAAGMVRAMAAHGRGGILVISGQSINSVPSHVGFEMEPVATLLDLLRQLDELGPVPAQGEPRARGVLRSVLHSGIDRTIAEIGGLTALDGATLLEPTLAVRAFGVILPSVEDLAVLQAWGAEPGALAPFPLAERGARHRAAATFARDALGSVVFVASSDGELGCLLRDAASEQVLIWRYSRS